MKWREINIQLILLRSNFLSLVLVKEWASYYHFRERIDFFRKVVQIKSLLVVHIFIVNPLGKLFLLMPLYKLKLMAP